MKKKRTSYPEQRRLLSVLYRRFGGLNAFANLLGVSPQLAFFWRDQGYIPLKRVVKASKKLKLSPYALHYKGYKEFTGEDNVAWKDVVTAIGLSKEEVKFVLG